MFIFTVHKISVQYDSRFIYTFRVENITVLIVNYYQESKILVECALVWC